MSAREPVLSIFSLPNELLEAIAAAGQEGRVPDLQSAFKSEWTLSHVSRRFRNVIIGAPALWTLVEVNFDAEGSMEISKLYLERSRRCNVWATLHYFPIDLYELDRFVPLIAALVDRVWRLRIVCEECGEALSPFEDLTAPNLQHLEVVNQLPDEAWSPVELFSGGVPRLCFLRMDGLKLQLPAPQWTASLTHLALWGGHDSENSNAFLVEVTAQCPLLVDLYLDMETMNRVDHRFHIPSLKFLRIAIADEDPLYLLGIIDLFDTPALKELVVDGVHGDQICVLFNSKSLPRASFPVLMSLSFVDIACTFDPSYPPSISDTSPPLHLFPALSSLALIALCLTTTIVDGLLGPASPPWPLLDCVTLCPRGFNLNDAHKVLLDAVQSKRQRGQPLPKFRLSPELMSLENWHDVGVEAETFVFPTRVVRRSW